MFSTRVVASTAAIMSSSPSSSSSSSWFFPWSKSTTNANREKLRVAETKLYELAARFGTGAGVSPSPLTPAANVSIFDTKIPKSAITNLAATATTLATSTTSSKNSNNDKDEDDDFLVIHGACVTAADHVTANNDNNHANGNSVQHHSTSKTPLVLLHGYMNAGAYFYRNVFGLSRHFPAVYSLDCLGWGLSSRPPMDLAAFTASTTATIPTTTYSISTIDTATNDNGNSDNTLSPSSSALVSWAESWFVDSLEAWRQAHQLDKMILAGHSMGGYLSVAYCEKYPQHVERLILLSPAGVPEESPAIRDKREHALQSMSWSRQFLSQFYLNWTSQQRTVGELLRSMPTRMGLGLARFYVTRRIPAITDPDEQEAVAQYLFYNSMLPGSGEHCFYTLLNQFAYAKQPLVHRIPQLSLTTKLHQQSQQQQQQSSSSSSIKGISFLYGQHDWMDVCGGLQVVEHFKQKYQQQQQQQQQQQLPQSQESSSSSSFHDKSTASSSSSLPPISVYVIREAGHLLMLDNWQQVNNGILLAAGLNVAVDDDAATSNDKDGSNVNSNGGNTLLLPVELASTTHATTTPTTAAVGGNS